MLSAILQHGTLQQAEAKSKAQLLILFVVARPHHSIVLALRDPRAASVDIAVLKSPAGRPSVSGHVPLSIPCYHDSVLLFMLPCFTAPIQR